MGTALRSTKSKIRIRTAKPRKQRARPRSQMDLETKTLPSQARSRSTFDAILRVAGEMLAEKGADAFSVNAVCLRGGLSPPAVYRYFPNKYALLKSLAERLMDAEDEAALSVMANRVIPHSEIEIIDEVRERLRRVVSVTSSFPGSVAILRALRTTPVMLEVRRASTAKVAARWFDRLRETFPDTDPTRLRRGAWLGLEISTQVIELIVEGESRAAGDSVEAMIDEVSVMVGRFYWQLGSPEVAGGRDVGRRSR